MRSFQYQRASNAAEAVSGMAAMRATAAAGATAAGAATPNEAPQFLAGGTTLIDLMKLDVVRPAQVIDIGKLAKDHAEIEADAKGLRLGGLARMADAANHPAIKRDYPVIAQALDFAASQQLRNMATLGGNVLQRTRCTYFRDVSWTACNKRKSGSGCAAMDGVNRRHAVLGGSEHCIATYPGDFAQSLMALDASVEILGPSGAAAMLFAQLHREPAETPHLETRLPPGALITAFVVPAAPWTRRSLYLKVRDRASYDFALASAAVALDMQDGMVKTARIALGGVATVPWRAREAESVLEGRVLDEFRAQIAARAAFASANPRPGNTYKVALGRRTLVRALLDAAKLEV